MDTTSGANSQLLAGDPEGIRTPDLILSPDLRDVENRSLFSVQTSGRELGFPSPEIRDGAALPEPAAAGVSPAAAELAVLATGSAASHPHHFVIETPDGPTCVGVCKHCGETRIYSSSGDADVWVNPAQPHHRQRAGEAIRAKAKAKKGGADTAAQNAVFRQSLKDASASGAM